MFHATSVKVVMVPVRVRDLNKIISSTYASVQCVNSV